MCNSQTIFFISNLFLLFTSLGILLYCSLALHVFLTSYGSDLDYEPTYYNRDPGIYDEFIRPRQPTFWDSIRILFGGEDYNNYRNGNELLKGPNKIAITRRKRQSNFFPPADYGPMINGPYSPMALVSQQITI